VLPLGHIDKMKLTDAINRYKSYFIAQRYSLKTWQYYEWELAELSRWLEGRDISEVEKIQTGDLYDYGAEVRQRGFKYPHSPNARIRKDRVSHKASDEIKEGTLLRTLIVIRAFYSYLEKVFKMENMAKTAFSDIKPKQTRETEYFDDDRLASVLENYGSEMEGAILHTLLVTGIRQGELRGCKMSDYSRERNELKVIGKGGAQRTVILTDECIHIIEHYFSRLNKPKTEYLFCRGDGSPLKSGDIIYMFQKISVKCGFRVTAHMLRHTMATLLAMDGVNPFYIQNQLGHKRAETTGRYVHVTPEMVEHHKQVMLKHEPKLVPEVTQPIKPVPKKKRRHNDS